MQQRGRKQQVLFKILITQTLDSHTHEKAKKLMLVLYGKSMGWLRDL